MKMISHKEAASMMMKGEAIGDFSYIATFRDGKTHRCIWVMFPVDDPRSHMKGGN